MTTWMQRLFGGTPAKAKARTRAEIDNPATMEDNSESGMRRQLVHVLLRDSLRRHGINTNWIDCQILVVSSRSRGAGMYVRLVVRHWDERLMRYLLAFQKGMQADLLRFEPKAAEWLHGISWQLEPENECPYQTMPDKSFWQSASSAISAVPASPGASAGSASETRPPSLSADEMAAAVRQANAARRASPTHTAPGALTDSRFPTFAATVPFDHQNQQRKDAQDAARAAASSSAEDDAARDLEALFAIRDRELGVKAAGAPHKAGYERTEPTPL